MLSSKAAAFCIDTLLNRGDSCKYTLSYNISEISNGNLSEDPPSKANNIHVTDRKISRTKSPKAVCQAPDQQPKQQQNDDHGTHVPAFSGGVSGGPAGDAALRQDLTVELLQKDLWQKFHQQGTEMIITKIGRRMFPVVRVRIRGLAPDAAYLVYLDMTPLDGRRYRYAYPSSRWLVAGGEDDAPAVAGSVYMHPDSPALGCYWNQCQVVSFDKLKLTNNKNARIRGQICLHSMQKYQPRIWIQELSRHQIKPHMANAMETATNTGIINIHHQPSDQSLSYNTCTNNLGNNEVTASPLSKNHNLQVISTFTKSEDTEGKIFSHDHSWTSFITTLGQTPVGKRFPYSDDWTTFVCRSSATLITFPETVFITVTAYQNHQITKLKINSNPFAKGFRNASKHRDLLHNSNQLLYHRFPLHPQHHTEHDSLPPYTSLPPIMDEYSQQAQFSFPTIQYSVSTMASPASVMSPSYSENPFKNQLKMNSDIMSTALKHDDMWLRLHGMSTPLKCETDSRLYGEETADVLTTTTNNTNEFCVSHNIETSPTLIEQSMSNASEHSLISHHNNLHVQNSFPILKPPPPLPWIPHLTESLPPTSFMPEQLGRVPSLPGSLPDLLSCANKPPSNSSFTTSHSLSPTAHATAVETLRSKYTNKYSSGYDRNTTTKIIVCEELSNIYYKRQPLLCLSPCSGIEEAALDLSSKN